MTRRRWLLLAKIGVALILLAMLAVALAIWAKPQFQGMVGTWFLPIIASGMITGSILLIVASWKLGLRSWRERTLLVWGIIGLTSPVFGYLILGPWFVMVLMLPVVIWILVMLSSEPAPEPAAFSAPEV